MQTPNSALHIDEVTLFIQNFIFAEHEAKVAASTERNDIIRIQKAEAALQYFDPSTGIDLTFAWERTPDEESIERSKQTVERMRPRILFQVKQYKHPKLGILYRAYVSTPYTYNTSYSDSIYLTITAEYGFKIISKYAYCMDCEGTGKKGDNLCYMCKGSGWEYAGGMELDTLGDLISVHKFKAPTDPASLKDYEAE